VLNQGALKDPVALEHVAGFFVESAGEGNFELPSSGGDIQGSRMEGHNEGDKGAMVA